MENQMSIFEIGLDKSNEVSEAALTNERTNERTIGLVTIGLYMYVTEQAIIQRANVKKTIITQQSLMRSSCY